ncbi:glycosyltransferase [Romboutsia ilealis]|uniref:Glycosyltransferase n=1 Tax=Romboutsia faecis TaxID=2764597 RepID=A0ABR7JLN3_9FIRM|nr:glycosyltransferase [Romboutsia faecis]MBC5995846.1 glycosyltransferase [Romboutsia faecis]MRN23045.1 glycosyltransferase [Romboutsia ilealis]
MSYEISVIVPVYNAEKYLRECLDSIINQSFKNLQIILVNDGSTDNSGRICEEYSNLDSRIEVIHKENGGASSARNKGLEEAKGRFIAFVDSDDYIKSNMYEVLYNSQIYYSSDISMCSYKEVDEDIISSNVIENKENDYNVDIYSGEESIYQLYNHENSINFIIPVNKLYKRELFRNLRYKEGIICEDELIIHELLYRTRKLVYIKDEMYFYRQTSNSVMRNEYGYKRLDTLKVLNERINFFKLMGLEDLKNKAIRHFIKSFFEQYDLVREHLGDKQLLDKMEVDFKSRIEELKKEYRIDFDCNLLINSLYLNKRVYKTLRTIYNRLIRLKQVIKNNNIKMIFIRKSSSSEESL